MPRSRKCTAPVSAANRVSVDVALEQSAASPPAIVNISSARHCHPLSD